MGFSDRMRAWFKGETKRSAPSPSTDRASRTTVKELEGFVGSRAGVEAYLEPKTAIYSTTLLLVADDGEYLRRPVRDRGQAAEFCKRTNIPLYDAAKVGYPRRMKDYDRGVRPRRVNLEDLPPWPGDADDAGGGPSSPPPPPAAPRD
ncbi:oxidoreductase [Egicoccus sp. AB-alg2]|uniref:oxidoreductase n=1 Tax=Egicoccus sp. AB-alg2 TaxID=3242693 RepID=UPI00359DAFF6